MRPTKLTANLVSSAALCVVLAAALVAAAPVRAEDDNKGYSTDTNLLDGLMKGIGLKSPNDPVIEYHERAPLAIPQSDTLPPPQNPGAAVANNPAWPKDADRARAKLQEQQKNRIKDDYEREKNPLSPAEMTPGLSTARKSTRRSSNGTSGLSPAEDGTEMMSPSDLGFRRSFLGKMFGGDDDKAVSFTGEPPRATLTDPPVGYQTPSPDQPYGPKGKRVNTKPEDSFTKRGEAR